MTQATDQPRMTAKERRERFVKGRTDRERFKPAYTIHVEHVDGRTEVTSPGHEIADIKRATGAAEHLIETDDSILRVSVMEARYCWRISLRVEEAARRHAINERAKADARKDGHYTDMPG